MIRSMYSIVFSVFLICTTALASAQSWKKSMNEGDSAYMLGKFEKADSLYRLGESNGATKGISQFNRGDALYRNGDLDGALAAYKNAINATDDPVEQAEAYHNIGNSLLQKQDAAGAVEAYKQALRLNPSDEDTRHNLAFALRQQEQQEQNQQEQEQQEQEQEQEQQEQGDEGDQDQQQQNQQEQGDEGDQDQQQQNQQEQEKGEQEKDGKPIPMQLSKEDAERMLEALNQKEKEIQQNLKKKKDDGKRKKIEKDW